MTRLALSVASAVREHVLHTVLKIYAAVLNVEIFFTKKSMLLLMKSRQYAMTHPAKTSEYAMSWLRPVLLFVKKADTNMNMIMSTPLIIQFLIEMGFLSFASENFGSIVLSTFSIVESVSGTGIFSGSFSSFSASSIRRTSLRHLLQKRRCIEMSNGICSPLSSSRNLSMISLHFSLFISSSLIFRAAAFLRGKYVILSYLRGNR